MQYDTLPTRPLAETLRGAVLDSVDITGCRFTGDAGRQDLYGLGIERCCFSDCRLNGCDFTRTTLQDVHFERCDLSGVHFDDAGLHRVRFHDCRLLGAYFNGALWDEVETTGSVLDYVNLIRADWKGCTLSGSFRDTALSELTVKKTRVAGCDFTRADWTHAHIAGLDLSQAVIEGTIFSLDGLQGVRVSREQAGELARLLGLVIV